VEEIAHRLRLTSAESIAARPLLWRLRELRLQVVQKERQPATAERDLDLEAVAREELRSRGIIGSGIEIVDVRLHVEEWQAGEDRRERIAT
jgi:hypothetical protein